MNWRAYGCVLALFTLTACGDTNVAETKECTPGVNRCTDDGSVETCNDNGQFMFAMQCALDEQCSAGECVSLSQLEPCADGRHTCDANATCTPYDDGTHTCECNDGYGGDGQTCTEEDPCVTGSHDCDVNALCTSDAGGSYECQCNDGFEGDGVTCTAQENNVCASGEFECDDNATCIPNGDSYNCECNDGFEGDGKSCTTLTNTACEDGNDGCDDNATCIAGEEMGSYSCECNEGFEGDGDTCVAVVPPECIQKADCPPPDNDCTQVTCVDGNCNSQVKDDENCCLSPSDCTSNDVCTQFQCANNSCVPESIANCCNYEGGGKVQCDDGNPCTVDTCNPNNQCTSVNATNGTSCGGTKQCKNGNCELPKADPKPGGNPSS